MKENKFQVRLKKYVLKIMLLLLQLCGFWPYTFENTTQTFKLNVIFLIMPMIIFTTIGLSNYVLMKHYTQSSKSFSKYLYANNTSYIIGNLFMIIWTIIFILTYVVQYLNYNNRKILITNGYKLFQKFYFNFLFKKTNRSYLKLILNWIFKLILNFVLIYLKLNMFFQMLDEQNNILYNCLIFFAGLIPFLITIIIPNFFYFCLLVIYHLFKLINMEIIKIMNEAKINKINKRNKIFSQMIKYCELSDNLDKLANLHSELCDILEQLSCYCSIHMLGWSVNLFVSLLYGAFFLYTLVITDIRMLPNTINIDGMKILNLVQLIAVNLEIVSVALNCSNTCNEVRKFLKTNYVLIK